ncbi:MAG TPA: tetratricopeptide repeat protein [Candidatus Acidoferrum sp.]|jgi:tetratricopeptide (TPR) repeat protein|nr:tetratricopeptide repeat protein [Candidatus Acidoferrum sp.]
MIRNVMHWASATAFVATLFCAYGFAPVATARQAAQQPAGQQPAAQPSSAQQQPAAGDKTKQATPLQLDTPQGSTPQAAPTVPPTPQEEADFKAFSAVPQNDVDKRIPLAEQFLQKYPQSQYRPAMYQTLVSGYLAKQEVPKMIDAGEKEIALNPNDTPILGLMGQTLARTLNPKAPDALSQLNKAESYSKRAIEVTPTLTKPAELTDEQFNNAKNNALEMAYSGLGLVYLQKGQYDQAIPTLEQSLKTDTHGEPDPVNLYLLGLANEKASHFDAAVTAFTKCAAIQSSLQANCKGGIETAKKASSTQLSAPK